NSWKTEGEIQAVQFGNEWVERSGKVLLYFSKRAFQNPFQYGDVVLVNGNPVLVPDPANPGEFDYKRFLTYRKIYHQHFISVGDALKIGNEPPFSIMAYSIKARVWAEGVLKKYLKGEREQATASALVLGVSDGLDNDLIGAYAATGSLHVLSVSGLHVGIIYWLILLFLRPLQKTTTGKWTLAFISIVVLWGYAFVTGLSPSVLRAVTMFSFVAVASPWTKRTNIYNTLAASAFCLLLYEPYLIMSVGFQLSYLAVIGIVYLQPLFSRLWEPKQWLWDNIWQITCVSIAAQLATFALGILYFHQFPVYFLFSNLFVIPLSFVVLVGGIGLIAVSWIHTVADLVGFLLEWVIKFLNAVVIEMEALPFSLIDNVYITTLQCWLLIGMIVFTIILIRFRKFYATTAMAACIAMFCVLEWNHFYEKINTEKLTVYKVTGHTAMDIVDRGLAYFFTDSILAEDRERLRFHIRPNRLQSGVHAVFTDVKFDFVQEYQGCRLIMWKGITIAQIYNQEFSLPKATPLNYVILGNNAIHHIADLKDLKFERLILDSSNSFYFADRMLKESQQSSLKIYSVLHQGAFEAKL
ncbi:MAG TPA: ComEC/Rec2 family competence protein, partial [Cyclobacteriaceae bacterium]